MEFDEVGRAPRKWSEHPADDGKLTSGGERLEQVPVFVRFNLYGFVARKSPVHVDPWPRLKTGLLFDGPLGAGAVG